MNPTPTSSPGLAYRTADFESLSAGLDYAARGDAGVNFYSARGELLRSLPYRELRETAIELARGLIGAGLPKGARFALLADTTADFMIFFHACQYAGLVPVPVALPTTLGGRDDLCRGLEAPARELRGGGSDGARRASRASSQEATEGLDIPLVGRRRSVLLRSCPGGRRRAAGASGPMRSAICSIPRAAPASPTASRSPSAP